MYSSILFTFFPFSALLNLAVKNIAEYRNQFIVSAEFNSTENDTIFANGFYSGLAIHSTPLTVNLLTNSFFKAFAGKQHSIVVSRQQLPNTLFSTKIQDPQAESLSRALVFCAFFFPTVALFVVHPLQETLTKVKQLQRMTGVTSISYWGTMLIFDLLIFTVCVLLITLALYIMDIILDIRLYYRVEICTSMISIIFETLMLYFNLSINLFFVFFSIHDIASGIIWH